jgi:hypothetical protein
MANARSPHPELLELELNALSRFFWALAESETVPSAPLVYIAN